MKDICIWLSAALIAASSTASAQTAYVTAEITGGTVNVDFSTYSPSTSFDLTGAGVHFVSEGVEPGWVTGGVTCKAPGCRPGDRFSLIGTFAGDLGTGIATVEGATINPAYFSGSLGLITGELTIPRGNRKHLVMSVPFTFDRTPTEPGVVLNVYPTYFQEVEPDIQAFLRGQGTATAFFKRVHYKTGSGMERFYYDLVRVIYSFDTTATAR
jgi:hypothetical protein